MAAALDGQIELVCGAFSSRAEVSRQSGKGLYLALDRIYDSYQEMIVQEAQLTADQRMDFVSIVTPNHMHYAPAKMALEHGFHVVCDKPLSFDMDQALELQHLVHKTGLIFALTHNYTGYPMVKQARAMIAHQEIGEIRKVVVAYPQGWLSTYLEGTDQKQARWRTDPSKSGIAGAMGDIGTHAENLTEYITGLQITELCADISTMVKGRQLDDDGNVLLRFNNGARGLLYASQISAGEENDLHISVYGEIGSLSWRQMEPNTLTARWLDKPTQIYRTGVGKLYDQTTAHTRLPAGHPEGYLEAFANIYRNVAKCIQARIANDMPAPEYMDYPTVDDGVRGMKFVYAVISSGRSSEKWTTL